jgi:hypothetical protein
MDRRDFVKTSLVTGASLVAGACKNKQPEQTAGGFFQSYSAPQQAPQGKLNFEYIRQDIPQFEVTAIRGTRYEDTIPDTLDIAERAKLGINVLTSITDSNADQEVYWIADFFRNPAVMAHDFNDWVQLCEGMMESLPLLRVATGSSQNAHVDPVWMQGLLKSIGPDGLVYVPMKGCPWRLISIPTSYLEPVWKEDGSSTSMRDPSVTQISAPGTCQRAIGTMTLYYARDKNPMWKAAVEKMIQRLNTLVVDRGDYAYFPGGGWVPNSKYGAGAQMQTGFMGEENNARMIQGLAQYHRVTGYEPAQKLASKLANYVRFQSQYYEPEGAWLIGPDERNWWNKRWHIEHVVRGGHGHAHGIGLVSMLEYGTTVGDQEVIEFVRTAYEWAKSNSAPTIGWVPETFIPDYPRCEADTIADMIAMALKLSVAGAGDYWDDADRWTRNHFAESQLTSADWVYRQADRSPHKPVAFNETGDHVPERSIGAFAGWSTANDWNVLSPDFPHSIQHCCTGNSPRTLYYIWEHMLSYDAGTLRVNLLLNRASAWVDVYSHIPYQGKVDLKVKKPAASLLVRMPEWIAANNPEVSAQTNGQGRQFRWTGRYLDLGSAKPGEMISVTFPIPQRRTKETIGAASYTLDIKGNTVVNIDPAGANGPLYQRSYYLAQQAPTRKVERFVAEEPVTW